MTKTIALGMPTIRQPSIKIAGRPDTEDLVDRYGRHARDLRISITEKCSLRCTYCMPESGLPPIPRSDLLTPAEIGRLVGIATSQLGVTELRLTGGEPLMRRDLVTIVEECRRNAPSTPIAMTTNAVGLDRMAARLALAGLGRVNVSLDSIDRERFAQITRRDRLPAVMKGIQAAVDAGLHPVKVNAVLTAETLSGASDLLQWCRSTGVHLRFIEQMALDADRQWNRENVIDADILLTALSARFRLVPIGRRMPSDPAEAWHVDGGPTTVGIIASVSRSFCSTCDRTRLTAEGSVRACLFSDDEVDLRSALRSAASDKTIAQLWKSAMWDKKAGHGMDMHDFSPPARTMGAIGG